MQEVTRKVQRAAQRSAWWGGVAGEVRKAQADRTWRPGDLRASDFFPIGVNEALEPRRGGVMSLLIGKVAVVKTEQRGTGSEPKGIVWPYTVVQARQSGCLDKDRNNRGFFPKHIFSDRNA